MIWLVLVLSFAISLPGTSAQRIFINQVPAYSALPACAEAPLSNIVRNMASGCGDGGRTTSYACFCAATAASHFGRVISTDVVSQCGADGGEGAATAAVGVFETYCARETSGRYMVRL